jgi:DUF4097 and DUF4098 domain-containing protein YvlB
MRKTLLLLLAASVTAPVAAGAQTASGTDGRVRLQSVQTVQPPPPTQPPPPPPGRRPAPRVLVEGRSYEAAGREEQRETFTKAVRIGSSGVLDIHNISGSIEVRRGGGDEAVIEVTKIARARTADAAREMLPLVTVDISSRGERAEVRTVYGGGQNIRGRNISVSVNYVVTAPQNTRVRAVTVSGNVSARDIRGELALSTTSGNVTIANASRVSVAKTTSGNVELTNIDSDVALDASAMSGDLSVRSVKARRLTLGTVSGRVIVQDVETERLGAQTFNGNIEFSGRFVKGGRYDLKAHSGDVRIVVAGGPGFEVEASSWSGNVRSDFSFDNSGGDHPQHGRRKVVRGVVGDGSAVVNITTFSGDIHLVKR